MAAEQYKTAGSLTGNVGLSSDARSRAALRFAVRRARNGLRWLALWPSLARGASVGAFLAAAWIVLTRFTLVAVPAWPAVVLYLVCVATSVWWALSRHVSASRAARFLDKSLALDERVSTLLEIQRSGSSILKSGATSTVLSGMLTEASSLLMERVDKLPRPTTWQARRKDGILLSCAMLALGASIVLPTPLDAVRAEQAALNRALESRLAGLESLRLEIAADPLITPETKAKLDAELWELQRKLRTPGLARSELVAALADTEEKLRQISTTPVSAYDSLLQAAQMVVERATLTSFWVEDILVGETELSRAADAAAYLSRFATRFTADEDRAIALTFDQSAQLTGQTHPLFTSDFRQAAESLRSQQGDDATRQIDQLARRFRSADAELRTSEALERTRSQLDESRRDVAQAGTAVKKRGQVGFRRRDTAAQSRATATVEAADSGGTDGVPVANTPRPAQGIPRGSDAPPDSAGPAAQGTVKPETPGTTGPAGLPGPPPSGDKTSGSTANPPGGGSASQDPVQGPSQSAPGQGGEGDNPGTLQGPVSGPVGGTSGAISRVPNPQGSGNAGSGQSTGSTSGEEGSDTVSLPAPGSGDAAGSSGSPTGDDASGQGKEGGQTTGDSGDSQERSGGTLTGIKTPYKEVVREYTDRANKVLERTYIPSDAKDYVKQYFTLLGQ